MQDDKICERYKHWQDGDLFFNCSTRVGADAKYACPQYEMNWLKVFEEEVKNADTRD